MRGRYTVVRSLGRGGMGAVYEAFDNVFDASVALKEISIDLRSAHDTKSSELARLAFEREAKLLAKISHETIPHVKDYFAEDDGQFLVMELVDGEDLAQLLKKQARPFPIGAIYEWTDQILDALDYLHTQEPPIIHRDIKPQNLKLTARNKIKLLDFGIAKGTDSQSANTVTGQTFIAATLNYSPLEQMLRVLDPTFLAVMTHKYTGKIDKYLDQSADVRSDLYALGATIYHLVTNRQPTESVKRSVEIWDGKPDPLGDPANLNPEITPDFAAFLSRSLEIDRDARYPSAAEMRSDLAKITKVSTRPSLTPTVQLGAADFPSEDTIIRGADHGISDTGQPAPTEMISEMPAQDTASSRSMATSGDIGSRTAAPEPRRRSKLLWIIPAALLLLIVSVVGIAGVIFVVSSMSNSGNVAGEERDDSDEKAKEPTMTDPEISNPAGGGVTLQSSPKVKTEPTATPEEKKIATPTATPVRSPTPRLIGSPSPPRVITKKRTKKQVRPPTPAPKKNMDCIFTDDCR